MLIASVRILRAFPHLDTLKPNSWLSDSGVLGGIGFVGHVRDLKKVGVLAYTVGIWKTAEETKKRAH